MWIKGKENQLAGLTKLKAVNWPRTWPSLSFCKKQPCPSLCVVHTGLILPLCHSHSPAVLHYSLLTQNNTSLHQGKTTSLLSYSGHWDLPLFSSCPQNNCAILLSRKVAKRNKNKSNVLKVKEMQPLWLSLLPFLVLISSWNTTRAEGGIPTLSNKSLSIYKSLNEKLHSSKGQKAISPGLVPRSHCPAISEETETEEQRCPVESTAWINDWNSLDSVT